MAGPRSNHFSPNKREKMMRFAPSNGCWNCGGPHYQQDCLEKKNEEQLEQDQTTVRDMGRSHRIHAVVHNCKIENKSTVLETPSKLNNTDVIILIDLGATESFISPNDLVKCKLVATKKNHFDQVEMVIHKK
jgi:hypothetical protein